MLIKSADDRTADVNALDRLLVRTGIPEATRRRIESEIRRIRAGVAGERDAAYVIDLHFGSSDNWAVIHDLRIEVGEHAAQLDHVIVNRLGQVWICESKHFAERVSVNEYGEWSQWRHGRLEGIPSPVEQNRRHVLMLERAFERGLLQPPKRLGLVRWRPQIRALVLVSNNARLTRPKRKVEGLDTVIKAEALKTRLFEEFDRSSSLALLGAIGKDGLGTFARDLAALHRPARPDWNARFGLPSVDSALPAGAASSESRPSSAPRSWFVKFDGPCAQCGRVLTKGTQARWSQRHRRMSCLDCATSA